MRKSMALVAVLLCLGGLAPVLASVPRVVMLEEFGATW
jgi:hypothetical protein